MSEMIDATRLYTLDEAARHLSISRRTIYRHIRTGTLPARQLGRRVYILGETMLTLPPYRIFKATTV